jgi:peroxiredoxin Q/BCP
MERTTFLIGADGRLLKAWRKVSVVGHADDVMKTAREANLL